jgi:hypothetical protein
MNARGDFRLALAACISIECFNALRDFCSKILHMVKGITGISIDVPKIPKNNYNLPETNI